MRFHPFTTLEFIKQAPMGFGRHVVATYSIGYDQAGAVIIPRVGDIARVENNSGTVVSVDFDYPEQTIRIYIQD